MNAGYILIPLGIFILTIGLFWNTKKTDHEIISEGYKKILLMDIKQKKIELKMQEIHLKRGFIPIPSEISDGQRWTAEQLNEYAIRANRAMASGDANIVSCVDALRKLTNGRGYGSPPSGPAYGDYSSFEYCQWMKERDLKN